MNNTNKDLASFLEQVAKRVEPKIVEILELDVDKRFQGIARYQALTGGKRLRPALCIICCRLFGGKINDALYPAAGLEILHNDTLLIDDIIDHSATRRNKKTCWAKFGETIAECVSIGYSASVFQAAIRAKKSEEIVKIFAEAMKAIADGEVLDILFEQGGRNNEPYIVQHRYKRITNSDYIKMVSKKTAVLFQASCKTGAISAQATRRQIDLVGDYGFNMGIAFQIQDDILDIFGKEKTLGKQIGNDFKERKLGNIVILLALKELSQKNQKQILQILNKPRITKKDINKGVGLIKQTSAREKAVKLGQKYTDEASKCLSRLPQNKWNKFLSQISELIIKRER